MRSRQIIWILLCAVLFLFASCKQEDDTIVYQHQRHWVEKTVAVVAPLSHAPTKTRLERTAQWFLDNFNQAQLDDTLCVKINLKWYDEQTEDLTALSKQLASDDNTVAVIGPFSNVNVALFAPACKETQKPLIVPTATSEELIRRYAVASAGNRETVNKKPFLWALTESDVAFTELLMSNFASFVKYWGSKEDTPEAALFTPNDIYGETFFNWLPFQAENFDVLVNCNQQYSDSADLQEKMLSFLNSLRNRKDEISTANMNTLCVVESTQMLYDVALVRRKWMLNAPELAELFQSCDASDPLATVNDKSWQYFEELFRTMFAFSNISEEGISALGENGARILQGYQGFSPYADPSTGFELSYTKKFGQMPTFAECKFYDALMLTAFSSYQIVKNAEGGEEASSNELFNSTIVSLAVEDSSDETRSLPVWNAQPMQMYLKDMSNGQYQFCGASGKISFDSENYTVSTHSTYVHWQILDGRIVHHAYYGRDSKHLASSTAAWKYIYDETEALKDFSEMADEQASDPQYAALTDQYAVLVHGSNRFGDYRHLADVLNVYQLLRHNGFDDDHIILIADTKVPYDQANKEPGIIRTSAWGYDLYGGSDADKGYPKAVVDYDASTLTPQDIADILTGQKSERLPVVLPTNGAEGHNVLLYWSGHGHSAKNGGYNELAWRDLPAGKGFTADMMGQTAKQMTFNKLFVVTEPCYSENVIRRLEGLTGVLAMSGASGTEQTWAENWNGDLGNGGIWMTDRFTLNLVNCLYENPQTTYRDLYLYCTKHTIGSHVKVVNAANFGNLYTNSPYEFFVKASQ